MSAPSTAGNVVVLARSRGACPVCGDVATWRVVGVEESRACVEHLGHVAEATPTDGSRPLTLVRIFPRGGAA